MVRKPEDWARETAWRVPQARRIRLWSPAIATHGSPGWPTTAIFMAA